MIGARLFDPEARILVLGDVMLDGYASGEVERISPEAPVPVLRHLDHVEVPGGGANVAMNIATLGGKVCLVGLVGQDEEAGRLEALLGTAGVETRFVVADRRPTTFKLRILAGSHQMLRIDKEEVGPASAEAEDALIAAATLAMDDAKAVVMSDYRKGCLSDRVLSACIRQAKSRDIPVFVDPKRVDFSAYQGASFITPNRSELRVATGLDCDDDLSCLHAAEQVQAVSGAAILLTRSEQGMTFFPRDADPISLPTEAQEVFDVSGAGDTVIATFALGIVSGLPIAQALRAANCAAGIVISRSGTATTTGAEVAAAMERPHLLERRRDGAMSLAEVRNLRQMWRTDKLTVGFTNGCFDLLHPGHVKLLKEAAEHCDRLVVGLNGDASVRRLKGPTRPIQTQGARAEVMSAIRYVDAVVFFDQDTPYDLIAALEPDVLIKGSDYEEHQIVGADLVKSLGGRVVRADLKAGHSTSGLVARSRSPETVGQ